MPCLVTPLYERVLKAVRDTYGVSEEEVETIVKKHALALHVEVSKMLNEVTADSSPVGRPTITRRKLNFSGACTSQDA